MRWVEERDWEGIVDEVNNAEKLLVEGLPSQRHLSSETLNGHKASKKKFRKTLTHMVAFKIAILTCIALLATQSSAQHAPVAVHSPSWAEAYNFCEGLQVDKDSMHYDSSNKISSGKETKTEDVELIIALCADNIRRQHLQLNQKDLIAENSKLIAERLSRKNK